MGTFHNKVGKWKRTQLIFMRIGSSFLISYEKVFSLADQELYSMEIEKVE